MSRDTGPSRATRALVLARDKGCVRCGDEQGPFAQHHRSGRRMGGSRLPEKNEPQNLLVLCALSCHPWIEGHPDLGRESRWLVRQGQDPSTVPVRWHGEWVLLEADGTVTGTRRTA